MDCLNYYHAILTLQWWKQLELQETEESKMVEDALDRECLRHNGWREGYGDGYREGWRQGWQEELQKAVARMLSNGFGANDICKSLDLSEEQFDNIVKSGSQSN